MSTLRAFAVGFCFVVVLVVVSVIATPSGTNPRIPAQTHVRSLGTSPPNAVGN